MTLDEMVTVLERFGPGIRLQIAARAARKLEAALKRTASAGLTPDGQPWAPKKDGAGRPYVNAAAAITAKAIDDLLLVTLAAPESFGHRGVGKTQVPRPMIPDSGSGIQPIVAAAITEAAEEVFAEAQR